MLYVYGLTQKAFVGKSIDPTVLIWGDERKGMSTEAGLPSLSRTFLFVRDTMIPILHSPCRTPLMPPLH